MIFGNQVAHSFIRTHYFGPGLVCCGLDELRSVQLSSRTTLNPQPRSRLLESQQWSEVTRWRSNSSGVDANSSVAYINPDQSESSCLLDPQHLKSQSTDVRRPGGSVIHQDQQVLTRAHTAAAALLMAFNFGSFSSPRATANNWWQFQCAPCRICRNIFHPVNFNIWTFLLWSEFFLFWDIWPLGRRAVSQGAAEVNHRTHYWPKPRREGSLQMLLPLAFHLEIDFLASLPGCLPGCWIFAWTLFWMRPRDAHWGEMAHCLTTPW